VQLGHRSPPAEKIRAFFPGWLGVSCHSADELAAAGRARADYAVLSPFFGVPSKGAPLGPQAFARLAGRTSLPLVALGGIESANAEDARDVGAAGVAVIRALRDAGEPASEARRLAVILGVSP
jgi:thiamine monophosphate synthase